MAGLERGRRGSQVVLGERAVRRAEGLPGFVFSPPGSPSKLLLARWRRFSANTEISQCLLLFLPSVCGKIPPTPGAEKVSVLFFSSLTLALAWKLVTLGPPAQEGGEDPSDVPRGKGTLEAN